MSITLAKLLLQQSLPQQTVKVVVQGDPIYSCFCDWLCRVCVTIWRFPELDYLIPVCILPGCDNLAC